MRERSVLLLIAFLLTAAVRPQEGEHVGALRPGTRVLLDAHNAYPENGQWSDRIDRALASGLPIAIEQDLVWALDPRTGHRRSVLSHGEPITGNEATLDEYFFARIRPLIERAQQTGQASDWPLITLNLDFKTNEPEHHRAVWDLLGHYESWLVTVPKAPSIQSLRPAPLLVLTGEADAQEQSFFERIPAGSLLRLFGAVHTSPDGLPGPKTNYRRWVNYPWSVVEMAQQPDSGAWTKAESSRLESLVRMAHEQGLWIRFYTLNGHSANDISHGWTPGYNFGSRAAATLRWRAAVAAGVDFVAVDQYEEFADHLRSTARSRRLRR